MCVKHLVTYYVRETPSYDHVRETSSYYYVRKTPSYLLCA